MLLRNELDNFAAGWRSDLTPAWQATLSGVNPNSLGVAASLQADPLLPIYPGRRGSPLAGARSDAHVFRAFDGLEPDKVRCVLIGQDPYPLLARATGRSFEQGDLAAWSTVSAEVASSLRNLVRMLLVVRTGSTTPLKSSWKTLIQSQAGLQAPRPLFDRLQTAQGVLFLNAGLTISRYKAGGAPEQLHGHIPYWAPVVGAVLRSLATRTTGRVVFLCLGGPAQQLLARENVRTAAQAAGAWGTRALDVSLGHPVSNGFMSGPNPFAKVNQALVSMNAAPIDW